MAPGPSGGMSHLVGWLDKLACGAGHDPSDSLTSPGAMLHWYLCGAPCYWRPLLVPLRAAGVIWSEDGPPCCSAFYSVPWAISSSECPPMCSCLRWLESPWVSHDPRGCVLSVCLCVNLSLLDHVSSTSARPQSNGSSDHLIIVAVY